MKPLSVDVVEDLLRRNHEPSIERQSTMQSASDESTEAEDSHRASCTACLARGECKCQGHGVNDAE